MNELKYIDKQFLVVFSFVYTQTSFFFFFRMLIGMEVLLHKHFVMAYYTFLGEIFCHGLLCV